MQCFNILFISFRAISLAISFKPRDTPIITFFLTKRSDLLCWGNCLLEFLIFSMIQAPGAQNIESRDKLSVQGFV